LEEQNSIAFAQAEYKLAARSQVPDNVLIGNWAATDFSLDFSNRFDIICFG
jgi:hypothetical protein